MHFPPLWHTMRGFLPRLLACLTMLMAVIVGIASTTGPALADDEFLAPEKAFAFAARIADKGTLEIRYDIADGYYMYRERFHFATDKSATLGEPVFPPGKVKFDETFQKEVETYRHEVLIRVPFTAAGDFRLTATSQGCTDKGLCYSPMDSVANFTAADIAAGSSGGKASVAASRDGSDKASPGSTPGGIFSSGSGSGGGAGIESSLQSGRWLVILPLFFLLGLGLSLTPCVLPMVPILSSIVIGEGARSDRWRGLSLSAVYVLGMALVYTVLGVAAGLVGEGLAAMLQNPWVLSLFALVLVALALSMFGFYDLQLPAAWQTRLAQTGGSGPGSGIGKPAAVFVMGALSALIVGPCVAPPLAGVLLYISHTRDVMLGGAALFTMAIGMGVPLLLVGLSAGALLPHAGGWMEGVKRAFGVLMLATALWMVAPVLPGAVSVALWAALGIAYGAYLLWGQSGGWIAKAVGVAVLTLGAVQLVNVVTGGRDALSPLTQFAGGAQDRSKPAFVRIHTEAELDAAIAQAAGRPVMLDYYADWCVSCIEMEKLTFPDPRVRAAMDRLVLLKADVTANNADDKALLKRYKLFGPPATIFFDAQGKKIDDKTLIGYEKADRFLQRLNAVDPQ